MAKKTTTSRTTLKVPAKTTTKSTGAKPKGAVKTRRLRFFADPNTMAELGFEMPDGRNVMLFGLVLNESQSGCGIVLVTNEKIRKDDPCLCKIGKLAQGRAVVRWVTLLEKNLMKIGIEYA